MENNHGYDYHRPVLLEETLQALDVQPDGIYIDGTAGGGGHSEAIARRLTTGHLLALDRDPDAIRAAGSRLQGLPAVVARSNFADMASEWAKTGWPRPQGILMDLGVSSHQLDTPERGFSYHHEAPLDMRMSQSGDTAADLIATLDARSLERIFRDYGDEKFARPIAQAIVHRRETEPIQTTLQLADIIAGAVPAAARRDKHPARKVFQALRIAVNGEMDALNTALDAAFDLLADGGRLAIITFHSLEDGIVKQRFRTWRQGCICPPDCPVCICGRTPAATAVTRKPVQATRQELEQNPRSRSAQLRCVQKLHDRNPEP